MPLLAVVSALLCRILLYTSLAYRTSNEVTFELSTPQGLAPHSILFCPDNPVVTFTKAATSVTSIFEGGDIFDRTETQLISQPTGWTSNSFFLGTSQALDPLEVCSVQDALRDDEYYNRTYPLHWLAGLTTDQQGSPIPRAVFENSQSSSASPDASNTSGSSSSSTKLTNSWTRTNGTSPKAAAQVAANCFMLTGGWKPNTRYQITVSFRNPPPPSSNSSSSSSASSLNSAPNFWVVPLALSFVSEGSSGGPSKPVFLVKGSKGGQMCSIRDAAKPYLNKMFDACYEAAAAGLVVTGVSDPMACLTALKAAAAEEAFEGRWPFTTNPIANLDLDSFGSTGRSSNSSSGSGGGATSGSGSTTANATVNTTTGAAAKATAIEVVNATANSRATSGTAGAAPTNTTANATVPATANVTANVTVNTTGQPTANAAANGTANGTERGLSRSGKAMTRAATPSDSCPTGSVLSLRFGGECVTCGNGYVKDGRCVCYPGYVEFSSGTLACGGPVSLLGNVSSAADLAQELCQDYSNYFGQMMERRLADCLVNRMYLGTFIIRAAFLLDTAEMAQANATFWDQYVTDERAPASPTRRTGIAPNCNRCQEGKFKDIYSGKMVAVRDDRFQAVNVFRFIGYLLHLSGHPCPGLWDPQEPLKWVYGTYDRAMCMTAL